MGRTIGCLMETGFGGARRSDRAG